MFAHMGDADISARLTEARKRKWDDRTLAQHAADMAEELLLLSLKSLHSDERTLLSALSRLAADARNRHFVQELCTTVFRAAEPAAQAAALKKLLAAHGGIPTFFSTVGRLRLRAAAMAAGSMEGTAMAEVHRIFRSTFGELSLPTQVEKVNRRVRELGKDKMVLALNPLSPEVFGNKGAERYQKNLEAILSKQEGVGITVQPWRLVPSISPYRPSLSARELADALKPLLQLSLKDGAARPVVVESGTSDTIPVVIEGIKLALAGSAFRHAQVTLELPGYLRQSPAMLRELTEWAAARAAKGARPLGIMLNKGSHLAEERACAHLYGASNAAAATKADADTRYKNLIHQAMAANAKAIRPAIATHNLFDLAYGLLDWARCGREGMPDIVLTAGLGNHIGRMLSKAGAHVTLMAGLVSEQSEAEFERYLLRLINEAANPSSLLAVGYAPEPNSMAWGNMRQQFLASLSGREEAGSHSGLQRKEDSILMPEGNLAAALDRAGMDELFAAAAEDTTEPTYLPLTIDGQAVETPLTGIHRSLTAAGIEEYRYTCADYKAVDTMLDIASRSTAGEPLPLDARRLHLLQLARLLEKNRRELCVLLVRDAGFTMVDADVELRNAADSCRFYEKCIMQDGLLDGTQPQALGVLVVASGRAHPLADAVGGMAAAWITGNSIIFKPTPTSLRLGYRVAELAQEAGMQGPRFQCIACLDNQIADKLMTDPRADGTLLPGNALVASRLASKNPAQPLLCAATGIATVYLSPGCNWQQAVHDLRRAICRRSGQAADCPRVVLADASVYDNQLFMNAMADAIGSLRAQPGWMEAADAGPLSRALSEEQRALLSDSPNEEETWLVRPVAQGLNGQMWTPGVSRGVRPDSPLTTQTARELPLIALVRVGSVPEALVVQKKISAAGAAALYAEDEEFIAQWQDSMAGKRTGVYKLFINCCPQSRPGLLPAPTVTLPGRRPAPQAGGPHYLTALCRWQEVNRPQQRGAKHHNPFDPWDALIPKPGPEEFMRLTAADGSLACWWQNEFGVRHELSPYEGETITRSYIPRPLCLRAEKETSDIDLSIAIMAALTAGCELQLSTATLRAWMPRALEPLGISITVEPRVEFETRFPEYAARGIYVRDTAATDITRQHAAQAGLQLGTDSVLANGRLELLHCVQECVVCRRG